MKRSILLLIVATFTASVVSAQRADRSKFISDSLQNYISRAMTNWRIPGAAICIIKDGKIVLMKGYGIKELGLNDAVAQKLLHGLVLSLLLWLEHRMQRLRIGCCI